MPINLLPEIKYQPARIYPLSTRDREVVDAALDKLQKTGKVKFTTQPTPFSYPVFVVWKVVDGKMVGRMVVDIRGLNHITRPDTHPILLQSDMISCVAGCLYISVVDGNGYFHQWTVKRDDRYKITVISHRGQEEFQVAPMGFKNSPPYVQRQTDILLRPFRAFSKAYIDDIVIFSKTLKDHVMHLRLIFSLFEKKRVVLAPKKAFIGYPSVKLLGQKVDMFGMSTSEEKLKAITSIAFPESLSALETYIGLTNWLRDYIPFYAQIVEPLQRKKTLLNKTKLSKNVSVRKRQAAKLETPGTELKRRAFQHLKELFARHSWLVHFQADSQLYIDLDSSKVWGLAAMVYHLAKPLERDSEVPRKNVRPIMFLNRKINSAEKNYWPTELEVAGLV